MSRRRAAAPSPGAAGTASPDPPPPCNAFAASKSNSSTSPLPQNAGASRFSSRSNRTASGRPSPPSGAITSVSSSPPKRPTSTPHSSENARSALAACSANALPSVKRSNSSAREASGAAANEKKKASAETPVPRNAMTVHHHAVHSRQQTERLEPSNVVVQGVRLQTQAPRGLSRARRRTQKRLQEAAAAASIEQHLDGPARRHPLHRTIHHAPPPSASQTNTKREQPRTSFERNRQHRTRASRQARPADTHNRRPHLGGKDSNWTSSDLKSRPGTRPY